MSSVSSSNSKVSFSAHVQESQQFLKEVQNLDTLSIREITAVRERLRVFSSSFFSALSSPLSQEQVKMIKEVKDNVEAARTRLDPILAKKMRAVKEVAQFEVIETRMQEMKLALEIQNRWLKTRRQEVIKFRPFNLVSEAPPVLSCPGYMGFDRIPLIGHYRERYSLSWPLLVARLHPLQFTNLPHSVQDAVGDLNGKSLDLHLIVSDGREVKSVANGRYNLITHPWVHPTLQKGDDTKVFPQMGLFEGIGIHGLDYGNDPKNELVSMQSLIASEVYAHPHDQTMCFSPNNAHFGISQTASFSAFWVVVKCDNRVLVSYNVDIHDTHNPFSVGIQKAAEEATTFGKYLRVLTKSEEAAREEIEGRLSLLAMGFENEDPHAMELFEKLPQEYKNNIYGEIWRLQGSPMGVHHDFGHASFHCEKGLNAKFYATGKQKAKAITKLADSLLEANKAFVLSQKALFAPPMQVPPPSREQRERVDLLAPIAQLLKGKRTEEALKVFSALEDKHKWAIYGMVWHIKGCPRGIDRFGELSFFGDKRIEDWHRCTHLDRFNALQMYMYQ